jgi:hypothetical protein
VFAQDHGTAFKPAFRQLVGEFSEPLEIGERISRFQRRKLTANLPRRRGSAPVDLIQPHTISFLGDPSGASSSSI